MKCFNQHLTFDIGKYENTKNMIVIVYEYFQNFAIAVRITKLWFSYRRRWSSIVGTL